jgi:hypothetical protein
MRIYSMAARRAITPLLISSWFPTFPPMFTIRLGLEIITQAIAKNNLLALFTLPYHCGVIKNIHLYYAFSNYFSAIN